MPRTVRERVAAMVKRPGTGSLLVLIVAALIPPPVSGRSAHLLGLPTLCPLRAITHVPCPGCGISRALCLCAHGRVWEAVSVYHPVVPFVLVGLIAAACYGLATGKAIPDRFLSPFGYGVAALLLAVWIARMLGWLPLPPL